MSIINKQRVEKKEDIFMKLKKVVSALLVSTMLLSCVACGNNKNTDDANKDNNDTKTPK